VEPNKHYAWEIQLVDGSVRRQYAESGCEQTWKDLPLEQVVRVSFQPLVPLLPLHHVFIDITAGERFEKRFGRGFMKQGPDGIKLREYVNCCVTNRHRTWVLSSGQVIVTRPDYELYM
jgi:hypothetical protein